MKKLTFALLSGALFISPAYAGDDHDHDRAQVAKGGSASHSDHDHDHDHDHKHHHEDRVKHFEVEEPDSWQEAIEIIETKGTEMKAAYSAKDYNKMHELSYSLEAAADFLEEEAEELHEAVEEVHHATEDGEEDELKEAFPELEERLGEITGK